MKYAKSTRTNKMTGIFESKSTDEFICLACGDEVVRKYGKQRQYFAHKIEKGNDCELKIKNLVHNINLVPKNVDYDSDLFKNLLNNKETLSEGLTEQQQAVVDCQGKRVKVESIFGSGKSHTAYHYSKARADKSILYLVYNSSMKKEAEELYKDLPNVEVRTMHSLAYKHIGFRYRGKLSNFVLMLFMHIIHYQQ